MRGIAIRLLEAILADPAFDGLRDVIIYNWHDVSSNSFYRHLGGEVIRETIQRPGDKDVRFDVFRFDRRRLLDRIRQPSTQRQP